MSPSLPVDVAPIRIRRALHIVAWMTRAKVLYLSSWNDFADVRDNGCIPDRWSSGRVLDALSYVVSVGWLRPRWEGIGQTPWAGSARRARQWWPVNAVIQEALTMWGINEDWSVEGA